MKALLLSGGLAMLISLLGTPLFIRFLVRRQYGQFIRQDGPTAHFTKRGTPTMGGVVIILATILGWAGALLVTGTKPTASAGLVLFLMAGLGLVGFLDDFIGISRERSLGLSPLVKIIAQGVVGITFAIGALQFRNPHGLTPASTHISFIRDTRLDLAFAGAGVGLVLFVIWALACAGQTACSLMRVVQCVLFVLVSTVFPVLVLLLSLFGRPDTFYWGLLVAPLLLVGLAFVPDAAL